MPQTDQEDGSGDITYATRWLIVAVLLAVLVWSGLRAYAAWNYRAALTVKAVMANPGQISPADLAQIEVLIGRALWAFPRHPDYLDLAGEIKITMASQPGVLGKQRRELLESAADFFRAALAERPLWPFSWVKLLATKDKLNELDMEFNKALKRALETGPWERSLQLQVLDTGLRQWDRLSAVQRDLVRGNLSKALQVQPREAFAIVRHYVRPDLLCTGEVEHVNINHWCKAFD